MLSPCDAVSRTQTAVLGWQLHTQAWVLQPVSWCVLNSIVSGACTILYRAKMYLILLPNIKEPDFPDFFTLWQVIVLQKVPAILCVVLIQYYIFQPR